MLSNLRLKTTVRKTLVRTASTAHNRQYACPQRKREKGPESSRGIESSLKVSTKKVRIKTSRGLQKSYMRQMIISNVINRKRAGIGYRNMKNYRAWRADRRGTRVQNSATGQRASKSGKG